MDKEDIIALMNYLSSSSSDEDDEIIDQIMKKLIIRPKIQNFIQEVVHSYSDKQVLLLHKNLQKY